MLESIHELVSQIINIRMAKAMKFRREVHGFRRYQGAHTQI